MSTDGGEISKTRPPHVGRYRLTKTLGRGAMGVVYLGYDEAIDRQVFEEAAVLLPNAPWVWIDGRQEPFSLIEPAPKM